MEWVYANPLTLHHKTAAVTEMHLARVKVHYSIGTILAHGTIFLILLTHLSPQQDTLSLVSTQCWSVLVGLNALSNTCIRLLSHCIINSSITETLQKNVLSIKVFGSLGYIWQYFLIYDKNTNVIKRLLYFTPFFWNKLGFFKKP